MYIPVGWDGISFQLREPCVREKQGNKTDGELSQAHGHSKLLIPHFSPTCMRSFRGKYLIIVRQRNFTKKKDIWSYKSSYLKVLRWCQTPINLVNVYTILGC